MIERKIHSVFACAALLVGSAVCAQAATKGDVGEGHDHRTLHANGSVDYGQIGDSYSADLVMYLAGNQFMVMEELLQDYMKKNPSVKSVFCETIPPGQILKGQILKQGEIAGEKINQIPDIFASVNLNHLRVLKDKGMMEQYMIYIHNKLELMVAAGNPKAIKGAQDLGRDDLVQSHPNPLTEGIFKFYGSEMLKDVGLYEKVTGGAMCKSCWAVPGKTWFTSRHHRETPDRIEKGEADVGIVWTTEVVEAKKHGRKIDGVSIPAPYNKADKVGYAIGKLSKAKNQVAADAFLEYLISDAAQNIYAKYGFVPASAKERHLKALVPTKKN